MSTTKMDLSKFVSKEQEISIDLSSRIVDSFFKFQKLALQTKNVKISGFGSFTRKESPSRIGRNPKTMVQYQIPKKIKISFSASKLVRKKFN